MVRVKQFLDDFKSSSKRRKNSLALQQFEEWQRQNSNVMIIRLEEYGEKGKNSVIFVVYDDLI